MMINGLTKIILGTVAVGAVCAGAAIIASKTEEKVAVVKADEDTGIKIEVESSSVIDKIKKAAMKKVVKILGFVVLHMEQIEAVSTIIGVTTGIIHIAGAIRDYRQGSDLKEQLDRIEEKLKAHDTNDAKRNVALGEYVQNCTEVLNGNLKIVDMDVAKVANKLGVQILERKEVVA